MVGVGSRAVIFLSLVRRLSEQCCIYKREIEELECFVPHALTLNKTRYGAFTAVQLRLQVSWDVTLCKFVDRD
jgi:hypothetical protein